MKNNSVHQEIEAINTLLNSLDKYDLRFVRRVAEGLVKKSQALDSAGSDATPES